jgi:hypothetical protein
MAFSSINSHKNLKGHKALPPPCKAHSWVESVKKRDKLAQKSRLAATNPYFVVVVLVGSLRTMYVNLSNPAHVNILFAILLSPPHKTYYQDIVHIIRTVKINTWREIYLIL